LTDEPQVNTTTGASAGRRKRSLRCGFSTGTAAAAAARAALRYWLSGERPSFVGVRLAAGYYLPVAVVDGALDPGETWVSVIKDGGDDPDVTHRAEILVRLRCLPGAAVQTTSFSRDDIGKFSEPAQPDRMRPRICLVGGRGVGVVTKPGLPVLPGEPAVNPTPRDMIALNLWEELESLGGAGILSGHSAFPWRAPAKPHVLLNGRENPTGLLTSTAKFHSSESDDSSGSLWVIEVEIEVPEGERLARHTLNPRLGIEGGISILGTTGLVRPFSHEAYEETIQTELSVARANGCETVVLSTGGKSEHYARGTFPSWPEEAFVQIADFFAFSVREARTMGCRGIVHSVFFGKAVKMAQGHQYTHAHKNRLDLGHLADSCRSRGYPKEVCDEIETANTARQALEILLREKARDVILALALQAAERSFQIAEGAVSVRLLLFNFDGDLLADVSRP
jgi:cobalt-precorrin-5B (C1)-methyltransferase